VSVELNAIKPSSERLKRSFIGFRSAYDVGMSLILMKLKTKNNFIYWASSDKRRHATPAMWRIRSVTEEVQ